MVKDARSGAGSVRVNAQMNLLCKYRPSMQHVSGLQCIGILTSDYHGRHSLHLNTVQERSRAVGQRCSRSRMEAIASRLLLHCNCRAMRISRFMLSNPSSSNQCMYAFTLFKFTLRQRPELLSPLPSGHPHSGQCLC